MHNITLLEWPGEAFERWMCRRYALDAPDEVEVDKVLSDAVEMR
jgi:hypothetical protein